MIRTTLKHTFWKGRSIVSDIILTNHTCSSMTVISNLFLDHYLPEASGEAIKVYLLILRYAGAGQTITLFSLAKQLKRTEEEIHSALMYWEKMGLLHITVDRQQQILSMQLLPIPSEPPVHSEEKTPPLYSMQESDVSMTSSVQISSKKIPTKKELPPIELDQGISSHNLGQLIFVTETYIGKPLSHSDLNTLFYIHDTLGLSQELIEFLVEHCVSMNKKSLRYMETVAIAWYEEGIRTVKDAKASVKTHNKNYYSIMKTFGLSGRNPGNVEIDYIKKWLDTYGFPLPIILEACDRTLKAIQQPSFPYADKILTDWKKANAMSLEAINKLDSARKYTKKPSTVVKPVNNKFHNFEQRTYDYKQLEQRFIQKTNGLKKGGE